MSCCQRAATKSAPEAGRELGRWTRITLSYRELVVGLSVFHRHGLCGLPVPSFGPTWHTHLDIVSVHDSIITCTIDRLVLRTRKPRMPNYKDLVKCLRQWTCFAKAGLKYLRQTYNGATAKRAFTFGLVGAGSVLLLIQLDVCILSGCRLYIMFYLI
jgi:hypothetical protein